VWAARDRAQRAPRALADSPADRAVDAARAGTVPRVRRSRVRRCPRVSRRCGVRRVGPPLAERRARGERMTMRGGSTSLLLAAATIAMGGCMWGPNTGSVYDGDGGTTKTQVVGFAGFFTVPNQKIRVQVLKSPDLAEGPDGNWIDVPGSPVLTGTQPYHYNDPNTAVYLWQLDAVPGAATSTAWPSGGLAKVRAQAINGSTVINSAVVFDDDFVACRSAHSSESWEDIMSACQSRYGSGTVATIVSSRTKPSDTLALQAASPYLSLPLGGGQSSSTGSGYYANNFFPVGFVPTLDAFKSYYGFGTAAVKEATAVYYNAGDLGLGREMHCRLTIGLTKVCYVTNYADRDPADNTKRIFGGAQAHVDSALAKAVKGFKGQAGADPVATVAMVEPLNQPILFLVYDGNGFLSDNATLDGSAHPNTEVPKNCITCHGAGGFDGTNVSGGRFLPFDLDSFKYSGDPGFTESDELASFRTLNDIAVYNSATTAIQQLHDGWYPDASSTFHGDFRPADWNNGASGANKVYDGVVKKYCRTCHVSMAGGGARPNFTSASEFTQLGGLIQSLVCDGHSMPQSLLTQDNFWNSPARAHIVGFLGLHTPCKP
jgi:hypothetical protein